MSERGDAEKTFDVEQAHAERASIDAEYAEEAAAEAAEQAQQWQPGDRVDITIRGVEVKRTNADGQVVIFDEHDMPYVLPPQAAIERAKPVGWPPQVGDLWTSDRPDLGIRLMAVDDALAVGQPAEHLIDDAGGRYRLDAAERAFGPLRLLYRDGRQP